MNHTDKMEFYQLLHYTDDVDLNAKLAEWEAFYNYARPHAAMNGKTPYERLKEKLCNILVSVEVLVFTTK